MTTSYLLNCLWQGHLKSYRSILCESIKKSYIVVFYKKRGLIKKCSLKRELHWVMMMRKKNYCNPLRSCKHCKANLRTSLRPRCEKGRIALGTGDVANGVQTEGLIARK